ncbi:PAS domain-containing protein [Marinomonas sp. A79]|uniref:histidine kinase n=1 Tax=Marinomonas vulgaris TaxID=2823372 RepID=A0ABS5H968_9GAMM|nr:PAS domain-containing protein [Marinomonas vulgaris]MBR7888238.1 PAS domain-containing protein [Marinomonas vulgaris]
MLTFLWNKLTFGKGFFNQTTKPSSFGFEPDRILDSLTDAVLMLDQDSVIHYSNDYWRQLSAQHKLNATTRFTAFLHPDDHQKWQHAIDRMTQPQHSKHHSVSKLLIRLLVSDGDIKWCEIHLQHSYNTFFGSLTATLRDVTTRIQKTEIGKANHRNLSGLVDRMPAILYRGRNNHNWSMEYISEGCKALTGYQPSQLINQPQLSFGDLIHPEDAEKVWGKVQVALQECRYFELHYRLLHVDGHYLNVIEKGQGIYSATGAVLSIEGVIMETL